MQSSARRAEKKPKRLFEIPNIEEDAKKQRKDEESDNDSATVLRSNMQNRGRAPPTKPNSKVAKLERELAKSQNELKVEKDGRRRLYPSLVKLANELKKSRDENESMLTIANFSSKSWFEGGMWRAPTIIPTVPQGIPERRVIKDSVSFTGLFFNLIVVIAFSQVAEAVRARGTVDLPILAYFCVFWMIWTKEMSFSTRFDTSDLSSSLEQLLMCFAVLFGSLSATEPFDSQDATRMMLAAGFVSILHLLQHLRVAIAFRSAATNTIDWQARNYALIVSAMALLETIAWGIGIFIIPQDSEKRWLVFLIGILLSVQIADWIVPCDFLAASSKQGILFILLLGFMLQSIVLTARPSFENEVPSMEHYVYFGLACFLFFSINLLYSNDTNTVAPKDHALNVNPFTAFVFVFSELSLLFATTVLGAGLVLLTNQYLEGDADVFSSERTLICGGYAGVVAFVFLGKSMHQRWLPADFRHASLFVVSYLAQVILYITTTYVFARMAIDQEGVFASFIEGDTMLMISFLTGSAITLVIVSNLDEAVELGLYGASGDADEKMTRPFGFFASFARSKIETGDGEKREEDPLLDKSKSKKKNKKGSQVYYSIEGGHLTKHVVGETQALI